MAFFRGPNSSKAAQAPKLKELKQSIEDHLASLGGKPKKDPASLVTELEIGFETFLIFLSFFLHEPSCTYLKMQTTPDELSIYFSPSLSLSFSVRV